jgi:transcriptional regulator with XRE-family HTH domain
MSEQINFGDRIRERRKILQITQEDLAKALGVTPQHISFIEQGKGSPSLTLLPRLAEELGVSVDYLLSGKESVVTEIIPAIKADKRINIKTKKALISLIEELYIIQINNI